MRVALISDIHGNLIALDAVLADISREQVDQIVCLGDVAATGPQPHEVIERLRALNMPVVIGNADAWLLDPQPSEGTDEASRQILEIDLWCAKQLSHADLDYLRSFQATIGVDVNGVSLLCFHGSPLSNMDIVDATTPEDVLAQLFTGYHAEVMAGGHTHVQMLRRYKDTTIVNPGSVGLPFEYAWQGQAASNPPWSEYALVSAVDGRLSIELRRVPLDVDAVVRAAFASGMAHAEFWASDWRK